MIGELDGWNLGQAWNSSLRQSFFPVEASRHESMPRTPSVTTLPFATAGELRGPEKLAAGGSAPSDSYLSCQSSLPVLASRQRMTSLPSCRAKTKSLSPTRAGVATPSPTVIFHFCANSFGQVLGALKSAALASRLGPRHWGQSCAWAQFAIVEAMQLKTNTVVRFKLFIIVDDKKRSAYTCANPPGNPQSHKWIQFNHEWTRIHQRSKAANQTGPFHLPSLCPLCLCGGTSYGNLLGITNLTTETQRTQRWQIIATARQCTLFMC